MKISTNNVINNFTDLRIHTKENSAPSVVSNNGHNFDAIIIQSDPRQIEEHTFAKSLSRQLSFEVKDTVSAERVQDLKNQVAAQEYPIDAHAIAARMLLL